MRYKKFGSSRQSFGVFGRRTDAVILISYLEGVDGGMELLRDWQIIKILNQYADKPRSQALSSLSSELTTSQDIPNLLSEAKNFLKSNLDMLDLPFRLPEIDEIGCIVPDNVPEKS
jgi:hypothetical protein